MLTDRCLIIVDPQDGHLQMHNHLRDLGRSIERQRPRQRFWEAADFPKKCPKKVRHSERGLCLSARSFLQIPECIRVGLILC